MPFAGLFSLYCIYFVIVLKIEIRVSHRGCNVLYAYAKMLLAVVCPIFVVGVCRYEYLEALRERLRPNTSYRRVVQTNADSTASDDRQLEMQPLTSSSGHQTPVCWHFSSIHFLLSIFWIIYA